MQKLSVILITYNEADIIERTLGSIAWADEIIIIDSGSTDQTVTLCQKWTPHVYHQKWLGFGEQKNQALKKANGDWILSLDADEVISPQLKAEMKEILTTNKAQKNAYYIPFHSYFLNTRIRHGDWRKEQHLRLFKRHCGHFDNQKLHENIEIQGQTGRLHGHINHFSYRSLDQALEKLRCYAKAGAQVRFMQGRKGGILLGWFKSKWAFFRSFILRLGFLDGRSGFLLACYIANYTFYRYVYLGLQPHHHEKDC